MIAFIVLLPVCVLGGNQLYTGDAKTVSVGQVQLQAYQDTTFSRKYRLAGSILTVGASDNIDFRLACGYLWNNQGQDARVGPNVGFKYRFFGDGKKNPSMAFSALYAINSGIDSKPHKNDFGMLLIGSYPGRLVTFLGNFGHVRVGDNKPNLYYLSMAAVRPTTKQTLVALEYSDLIRIGQNQKKGLDAQFAIGTVYTPDKRWSYSIQLGYLPYNPSIHYHTTIGISRYF